MSATAPTNHTPATATLQGEVGQHETNPTIRRIFLLVILFNSILVFSVLVGSFVCLF